jgi:hypothetical protein
MILMSGGCLLLAATQSTKQKGPNAPVSSKNHKPVLPIMNLLDPFELLDCPGQLPAYVILTLF